MRSWPPSPPLTESNSSPIVPQGEIPTLKVVENVVLPMNISTILLSSMSAACKTALVPMDATQEWR